MASPRYLVGIDLGTTNTVVAYCEIEDDLHNAPIKLLEIDQLIGPGEVARKPLLPSFRYHPAEGQIDLADTTLPWQHDAVEGDIPHAIIGEWAREMGAKVEGRQVASAKSWLSHQGADRRADILPWAGAADVDKVSPVIASASYLNHLRQAWNYHNPCNQLEHQHVVVTIPASFDESARKLTLEAAKLAGLHDIALLEEPQAVFYDWYARHKETASEELSSVPLTLVCDVGGGTTDLSLIQADHQQDSLKLSRIGVGEHLMLGGDNIDLALAHLTEQKMKSGKKLNAASLSKLIQQTRRAKEDLLSSSSGEQAKITVLGSGSKLLGGTKSVLIDKNEVHDVALDGFFPLSTLAELPNKKRSAVMEFGLPYVADPAVSKHLAEFLSHHQASTQPLSNNPPTADEQSKVPAGLLLNGGVFNSPLIRERIQQVLSDWRGAPVTVLDNPHPDLSVALGAVAYGKAQRGAILKIGGGVPRSYFLQLPDKKKQTQAVCLLEKGTEEGQEIRLSGRRFSLTLGEPVRFNLLTTTHDELVADKHNANTSIQNGAMVAVNSEQFNALPPYIATLDGESKESLHANQKERVEVILASQMTEVGTLKLECVSADDDSKRWQLEFEVRQQQESDDEQLAAHPRLSECKHIISHLYSGNKKSNDSAEIKTLARDLEKRLGKREDWDFYTLRQLFDTLAQGKKRRKRSGQHEKNWFRLAGYSLRPGFGDPTDDWRITNIWPLYQQGIQTTDHQGWTDWWVFWRRVSGGLSQDQQETILADIAKYLHPGAMKNAKSAKEVQDKGYESIVRLAASLEQLHVEDKVLLSSWFLSKALNQKKFRQAHWWALGRLAARVPLYASQHNVITKEQVHQWLPKLLSENWLDEPIIAFATVMMCRETGDRSIDVSDQYRDDVLAKLKQSKVPDTWIELVASVSELSSSESKRAFGDALPTGLHLLS